MRQARGGYSVEKKEQAAPCEFEKMEMIVGGHSPRFTVQPHPINLPTFKSKPVTKLGSSVPEEAGTDRLKIASPLEVLNDVRDGLVSPEEARVIYAVVLVQEAGDWRIDEDATTELRSESRRLSERRRIS